MLNYLISHPSLFIITIFSIVITTIFIKYKTQYYHIFKSCLPPKEKPLTVEQIPQDFMSISYPVEIPNGEEIELNNLQETEQIQIVSINNENADLNSIQRSTKRLPSVIFNEENQEGTSTMQITYGIKRLRSFRTNNDEQKNKSLFKSNSMPPSSNPYKQSCTAEYANDIIYINKENKTTNVNNLSKKPSKVFDEENLEIKKFVFPQYDTSLEGNIDAHTSKSSSKCESTSISSNVSFQSSSVASATESTNDIVFLDTNNPVKRNILFYENVFLEEHEENVEEIKEQIDKLPRREKDSTSSDESNTDFATFDMCSPTISTDDIIFVKY